MDSTLESIRPSAHVREEMSYLFGRDPSILAHGQRPCPSKDTQKNLFSLYYVDEENSNENGESLGSDAQSIQTVKVYLRMKPFPKKMKPSHEEQEAYQIISPTSLYTKLPVLESNTSCLKRSTGSDILCRKFTFTKTFGPETTQLALFEQAVKQQMVDFLAGQNSTIMTYGTTNSGKSYTLQGTTTSPGIIPRGLEFVFSNISPKPIPCYKPVNHCDVVILDPLERAQELEIKTKLLTFTSVDKHSYMNTYKEMQKLLQEESPIRPSQCNDAHYSVWVSFAEIYNETVYDLLSNECQKKKTPLKLATDSQGRAFIKGLKTVCVNSGSEAYQVLMAGQYNLKVAATALNARSSRSHCIFTIKLLKYYKENLPNDVEVSTFAFCDLAGSERLKKTLNIGDRLKEAQNINTSLLVLGRCLKTIHEGQLTKQKVEHVGPFRESKLTRLFQKALSGKEHIVLIVNINPLPNLYIETQNVLSFSAIAKKIVIEKEKPRRKKRSRFSQLVTQSIKTVTDWDASELESEEWQTTEGDEITSASIQDDDYEDILAENEQLKKEIAALKSSALTRDLQIRQEMADTYTTMMKELESEWKNRIKDVEQQQQDVMEWSIKQVEDFYKQKINQLSSRKRQRSCTSDEEDVDDSKNIDQLELENSRLTSKVVSLKHSLKQVKETNEALVVEKNKITFELGLTKEEVTTVKNLLNVAQRDVCSDEESQQYTKELQEQLYAKQEQVKKLKVFLNEAKEEYIAITTEAREKEYQLKEQEELIVEDEEKIEELESHLEHINICLTEKIKIIETLEEKVEAQTKKLANADDEIKNLQSEINKLEQEKLILRDEIQLLKKSKDTVRNSLQSIESNPKDEPISVEDSGKDTAVHTLDQTASSPDDKPQPVNDEAKPNSDMDEKIIEIQAENSALKQKLTQSLSEIESLKDELDLAKVKVKDIATQIHELQMTSDAFKPDDNETTDKPNVQLVESGCQVDIQNELESNSHEQNMENKCSQTNSITTAEQVNQTSFIDDCDETDILDEFVKLIVKYEDLKDKYKTKCLRIAELGEYSENDDIAEELARLIVKYDDLKNKYKATYSRSTELEDDSIEDHVIDDLTKLIVKYDDLKDKYKSNCMEIVILQDAIEAMVEDNDTNNRVTEEYTHSIELLQKEIANLREEKKQTENALQESDNMKVSLEKKIADYETHFVEVETELRLAQDDNGTAKEELQCVKECLDNHVSKCKTEHEQTLIELKKELSVAKERNDIKSQCLDVHAAKITELETNLQGVTELHVKISELNEKLKDCQAEKDRLQKLYDENNEKILELEDRLQNAEEKEREKECEIHELQKEMKRMIQKSEGDDKGDRVMELEMKNTLKDLTNVKELLSQKQEEIENLQIQLKTHEQSAKYLDLLEESARERQAENERLRIANDELKRSILEKVREMESFTKNRDEMISKFEALVKSQQEQLEKQKKELTVREATRKQKDCYENTSEDEVVLKERRTRRAGRKAVSPVKQDEISVIDLSGSDTKRNGRRTALAPPPVEPLTDKKRSARRKKLYIQDDESFHDIEPLETTVTVTPSQTRSLRSRRK